MVGFGTKREVLGLIDKIGKALTAEDTSGRNLVTSVQISLDCNPTYPGSSDIINAKQFLTTQGRFWVKYKTSGSFLSIARPFVIASDLYSDRGGFFRVASWDQFVDDAKNNARMKFLLDYTNVCKEHFDLALENKYTPIPVSFNILKYDKAVKEKYKIEHGSYPKGGVLVDPLLVLAEEERRKAKWENYKLQSKIRRENKLK